MLHHGSGVSHGRSPRGDGWVGQAGIDPGASPSGVLPPAIDILIDEDAAHYFGVLSRITRRDNLPRANYFRERHVKT